jgi:hypothetical protein
MPTLYDISSELAHSFVRAKNKKHAVNHLIIEINSLRYQDSKKLIDYNVKAAIVSLVKSTLPAESSEALLFYKAETFILKRLREQ